MDSEQESPGKVGGFRFRAGEDDLEELAADPETESLSESLHQKIISRSKKLLNKDTSLSDSEDNSESVQFTEWWKDDEDLQPASTTNEEIRTSLADIKGKEIKNGEPSTEVEAGEEADEILPSSQLESETDQEAISHLDALRNLGHLLTWVVPIYAASWLITSEWWRGIIYGASIYGLSNAFFNCLLDLVIGVSEKPKKGKFSIPDYEKLPPLRTIVDPHQKQGCFNVYNKPYDPETYRVRQTRTVCLELTGNLLKITNVKTKLPKKAQFRQTVYEVDSSRFTVYNLSRCSVMLLPHGLARKRLFSKKYPIMILLGDGAIQGDARMNEEPYHTGWNQEQETVPATPALYLFARCDRDKEDWYRRLLAASTPHKNEPIDAKTPETNELSEFDQYLLCMSQFVKPGKRLSFDDSADSTDPQWLNALINRVLFDVFRSEYWNKTIQEKLQRKLSLLKLPYNMEEMQITELDLGTNGPIIHRVSKPVLDERGLWFDMDLTHNGCIKVTIQTKMNLYKLQKGYDEEELPMPEKSNPMFDNEAEDSAETSSEEEESPQPQPTTSASTEPENAGKVKRKQGFLFSRIGTLALQHVVQTKVGKRMIAKVSETKLRLQVRLDGIIGTVAVNVPPPPSDRIWYGFRGKPKMWLNASPVVGERSLTFSWVKQWIEKKLTEEFQVYMVLPHMRPLLLPTKDPLLSLALFPIPSPNPSKKSTPEMDDQEKEEERKLSCTRSLTNLSSDSQRAVPIFGRLSDSGSLEFLFDVTAENSNHPETYRRRSSSI